MVQQFFFVKRSGNLKILEGKFCFDRSDRRLGLQNLMKNGGAENEIFGRNIVVGMGGIGIITSQNCYFSFKIFCQSVFKAYICRLRSWQYKLLHHFQKEWIAI